MSEQRDVISELEDAGVLSGVRWAYLSATRRALEVYSEPDGHDAALLGAVRFTTFRDRLDRVFACERYAVPPGGATADLDTLYAQLSEQDIEDMPRLAPTLVERADLSGSPGWVWERSRFLLASGEFGRLDRMPWPQKSPTKQRVARQHNPDPAHPSLFDAFADEEIGGLAAALAAARLDPVTYVVAHSLDPVRREIELVFGRPRLNSGGGAAWHWTCDLLDTPPAGAGRRPGRAPLGAVAHPVPEAPVRLRPGTDRPADGRVGGDR